MVSISPPKLFIANLFRRGCALLEFLCLPAHLVVMTGMTGPSTKRTSVADRQLSEAELNLTDQQGYVRRMIVCGAPTQAAEDRLRELEQKLLHLRTVHGRGVGRS
jgi:hypothetical protein